MGGDDKHEEDTGNATSTEDPKKKTNTPSTRPGKKALGRSKTSPPSLKGIISQTAVDSAIDELRGHLLDELGSKQAVIKALDTNGDGCLTLEEFGTNISKMELPLSVLIGDVSLERIFQDLDLDGNGELSLEELMENNPWKAEEDAVQFLRDALVKKFGNKDAIKVALDEDKSGSVSYGELEKMMLLHGMSAVEATGGVALSRIYDLLDANCSGELTWDELLESDARKAAQECDEVIQGFRDKLAQVFGGKEDCIKALDTNGNRFLSYTELKSGLERTNIPMRGFLGNKDFRWLFRVLDVDTSGQISAQELVELDPKREAIKIAESRRRRFKQRKSKLGKSAPAPEVKAEVVEETKDNMQDLLDENSALKKENAHLRHQLKVLQNASQDQLKDDYLKLQKEYGKLQQECERLRGMMQGSKVKLDNDFILDELRKLQVKYNAAQDELVQEKVAHLQQATRNNDVEATSKQCQQENKQMKKLHARHRRLEIECKEAIEGMAVLRVQKEKNELELGRLTQEHEQLIAERERSWEAPQKMVLKLQEELAQVQDELVQVKDEYSQLQAKHKQMRLVLSSDWDPQKEVWVADDATSMSSSALLKRPGSSAASLPSLSRPVSGATPQTLPSRPASSTWQSLGSLSQGRPASSAMGAPSQGLLNEFNAYRDALKPNPALEERPSSRGSGAEIKKRMTFLNGQVRYCEKMWQDLHNSATRRRTKQKDSPQDSPKTMRPQQDPLKIAQPPILELPAG